MSGTPLQPGTNVLVSGRQLVDEIMTTVDAIKKCRNRPPCECCEFAATRLKWTLDVLLVGKGDPDAP